MSWLSDFLFGAKVEAPPLAEQLKEIADAYTQYGPKLFEALNAAQTQGAQNDYKTSVELDPKYAQLQTDLLNQYGPGLAAAQGRTNTVTGNDAAALEQQLIRQYGPDTARAILATTEAADPRATAAKNELANLYSQFTSRLSPELSGSELAGINRSIAQQNPNQNGSTLETIKNAQLFGDKGASKLEQFGRETAQAASLIPALSSGVNPFAVSGLGKSSSDSTGSIVNSLVNKDITDPNGPNALTGSLAGLRENANNIDALNRDRGFLQAWVRGTEGLKNVGSAVGDFAKAFAMCYIAREVFGLFDPRWVMFRDWLNSPDAPERLRDWYTKNGQRVALWLQNRPETKVKIKNLMISKIYGQLR